MYDDWGPDIFYLIADKEMVQANLIFYSNLLVLYSFIIMIVLIIIIGLLSRELIKKKG